jgi:hypothetical protein
VVPGSVVVTELIVNTVDDVEPAFVIVVDGTVVEFTVVVLGCVDVVEKLD